jgi:PHD/YefM family antitoxin component YafN of YafNO toxin-antitoxin module
MATNLGVRNVNVVTAQTVLEGGHVEGDLAVVNEAGKKVAAVVNWERYESLLATVEVLSDQQLMQTISASLKDAEEGRVRPWTEVKAGLGL